MSTANASGEWGVFADDGQIEGGFPSRREVQEANMWRTYQIRADKGMADSFYAPDLETAFRLARAQWPGATQWECLGSEAP